jgi:ATP sulfurylase
MKFSEYYFFLEQTESTIIILPGGFKPPHKGHFEALKFLLKNSNAKKAVVFVGKKEREGITQDQALKIWDIYKKYIPAEVEVVSVTGADKAGRDATPLSMTYDFIENNKDLYEGFIVGAGEEDLARFKGLEKDKIKYPNTKIVAIPPQFERISGTKTRQDLKQGKIEFIPKEVKEVQQIKTILGI